MLLYKNNLADRIPVDLGFSSLYKSVNSVDYGGGENVGSYFYVLWVLKNISATRIGE